MYVVYISKYREDDEIIETPKCVYDPRSGFIDIFSPICNLVDSAAGTFTCKVPTSSVCYNLIVKGITMFSVYRIDSVFDNDNLFVDWKETYIFEGRVMDDGKDFNNHKLIEVEGAYAFLNDSTQPLKEFFDISMKDFVKALIEAHNDRQPYYKQFTLDEASFDMAFPEGNKQYMFTQYESTMQYFIALHEAYGGHIIVKRKDEIVADQPYYILKYIKNLPKNPTQVISFGKNLLDYSDNFGIDNVATVLLPISSQPTNNEDAIGEKVPTPSDPDYDTKKIFNVNEYNEYTIRAYADDPDYHPSQADIDAGLEIDMHRPVVFPTDGIDRVKSGGGYLSRQYEIPYSFTGRLYISSRTNNVDPINHSHGHWILTRTGNYTPGQIDVLNYGTLNDEGWTSISNVCLDFSYTPEGAQNYSTEIVGSSRRLEINSWGGTIPAEVRIEKYPRKYVNHELGDEVDLTDSSLYFTVANSLLARDTNWAIQDRYKPDGDLGGFEIGCYKVQPDDEKIFVCCTSYFYYLNDQVKTDDAAIVLYDNVEAMDPTKGNQLSYYKKDSDGPWDNDSRIFFEVDLTTPENRGAKLIAVQNYGTRIPIRIFKARKTSGKIQDFVTVEKSEVNQYHSSGDIFIKSEALMDLYGRIEKKIEFNGIGNPNDLAKAAIAYLNDTQFNDMSINVSGADLHELDIDIDAIDISSEVRVLSKPHDLNKYFPVTELTINIEDSSESTMTLASTNDGYYYGESPAYVISSNGDISSVRVYGTENGFATIGGVNKTGLYLKFEDDTTKAQDDPTRIREVEIDVYLDSPLTYPDSYEFDLAGVQRYGGLIEVRSINMDSETGEYPLIEFHYDKRNDGSI